MESDREDESFELIGWIGSVIFTISSLTQLINNIKTGNSNGLTWSFLLLWLLGEILTLIYVVLLVNYPLIFTYTCDILILLVIIYYKLFPRLNDSTKI